MNKNEFRKEYRAIRDSVSEKQEKSRNICRLILESELYKKCYNVFVYYPIGSEVSVLPLIEQAILDGKKLAFPRCIDKNGTMKFFSVSHIGQLEDGFFGLKEPPECSEELFADECTLCILPGLCFGLDGNRLGYGKGYYDRFLSEFKGIRVGICYEECLTDALPADGYDKKMHYTVTEKKIYNFT